MKYVLKYRMGRHVERAQMTDDLEAIWIWSYGPIAPTGDLRTLVISDRNAITSIDLTPLAALPNLQLLHIEFSPLQSIDLTPLSSCVRLRSVDLVRTGLERLNLSPLSSCTDLERLVLWGTRIGKIDLTPLAKCTLLKELILQEARSLDELDLSPLSSCRMLQYLNARQNVLKSVKLCSPTALKKLDLSVNRIEDVDLTPLSACAELEELRLSNSRLRSVDLSPLRYCTNLKKLALNENRLEAIDLTPLGSCTGLEELRFSDNMIRSTDPTPLFSCTRLDWIILRGLNAGQHVPGGRFETLLNRQHLLELSPKEVDVTSWGPWYYDSPRALPSLSAVSFYVPLVVNREPSWKGLHLLHNALALSGLGWAGFLDMDPIPLLEHLLQKREPVQTAEFAQYEIVPVLCKQIDSDGTTIGLSIEKMRENGELAFRISRVLYSRKVEMESVCIPVEKGIADLRALWLTAYGHDILAEMRVGIKCKMEKLEAASRMLMEMGYEVRTADSSEIRFPNTLSQSMREYIWKLAEYKAQGGEL